MTSYPTSHYFELGQQLNDLYWRNYSQVLDRYPEDRFPNDVRPALFSLPGNAIVGYLIAMAVIETTLTQVSWWATYTPYRTEPEIRERLQHYEGSIRQAYFVLFASRFEWVIRNMLAVIDPGACHGALNDYKQVYDALLARIDRQNLTAIFDVTRHLRNSLHNNGVYCNRQGKDSPTYVYREQPLKFVHGKTIHMATELSFQLMEDLILAAREIIDSPSISALKAAPFTLTTGEEMDPRSTDA